MEAEPASGQSVQRYYDPMIPRFLSVDAVTAYSDPIGAFHRYRYANNNPYRFADPDGRLPVAIPVVIAARCAINAACRIAVITTGRQVVRWGGAVVAGAIGANEGLNQNNESTEDGGGEGTRELGELEPIHAPDHPQNNPEIGNLSDEDLGNAINNPGDGEKVKVRGNKVLDGNTRVNEAKKRDWPGNTVIPVEELPPLPDNIDDDPLGPYRE